MAFLTKDDFENIIRDQILDDITDFDDSKLDTAVLEACSLMKGYLNNRYDVIAIFDASGSDRHPIVMMYCKDIVIYHLHSLINPRKVPEKRVQRYNSAIKWLEEVNQMIINPPDLPRVADDDSRSYVKFGGNDARQNYI